tara:strand:+ start:1283 stop:1462 length:180 start_codon:yes stop_codon:yes gene_type:complete
MIHSARHSLRKIRQVVNDALASLDAEFEALYTCDLKLRREKPNGNYAPWLFRFTADHAN